MRRYASLLVFLVVTVGGGLVIGSATLPGPWYASLAKPSFTPPNWLFGPVWTLLYILIALAGWRIWLRRPTGVAFGVWVAQLVLNFLWSPLFFGAHLIGLALGLILVQFATILMFIVSARRVDKVAVWLFAPYALWVAFASLLNAALAYLN